MRLRHLILLASLAAILPSFGCGSDDDPPADPCLGVVCRQGQDCREGICVDRKDPEPTGCRSNNDCQFDPAGAFCERETGRCVACLDDGHCHEGRTCELGICAGAVCTDDRDCAAPTPVCAEDGASCVECRDDEGCGEGEVCSAGACVDAPCAEDADCTDPEAPRCAPSGLCVACLVDGDCAHGEICEENACVPRPGCHADVDCEGDPAGARCDTDTGACVPCVEDDHCGFAEACVDNACGPRSCEVLEDCPAGAICVDEVCAPLGACEEDPDCAADPRVPRCSAASTCVACTSDADCGGGRCVGDVCLPPEACTSDAQCKGSFVCTGGGCAACRTDEQCPRGACRQGVCEDRISCVKDADCASGSCVAGACEACGSDLDCRPGLWCEGGACAAGAACADHLDCAAGELCDGATCQPAGCSDDTLEPDGGPAAARPVGLGTPASRVLCPNDEDWMAFAAAAGSPLEVSVLAGLDDLELSLVWFEPGDERVRHEVRAVRQKILVPSLPPAAANRYFLRVRGEAGAQGAYTLLPKAGTAACTDALEPNNRWDVSPPAIEPGVLYEGLTVCDADYYRVAVPAHHAVAVYALYDDGEAQVSLFTEAGQPVPGTRNSPTTVMGGGRVLEWDGSAAATQVLARVQPPGATQRPPSSYRLYVAVTPSVACDAGPMLLDLGEDRARATGATLGRAAGTLPGACGAGGPEVTYALRLDEPSRLVARVAAPFDAVLSLRDAACTAEQSCGTAAGGAGTLDVPRLEPGDYVLAVGGPPGQAGPFDLALRRLDPIDPPANDSCVAPIPLAVGPTTVVASGDTEGATPSGPGGNLCLPAAPDVYYSFDLAAGARVVAEVTADEAVSLAFADDACAASGPCTPAGRKQRLDHTLDAGTHLLRVASATGAATSFTLRVTAPDPLPNDTCAAAAPLAVPGAASGDTTWATNEVAFPLAESCTGYYVDAGEVFHAVTLEEDQTIEVELAPGPGFDAALYVMDACDATACLAGADAPGAGVVERLSFTAPEAGTYFLVVDGAAGGGTYTLTVSAIP
ncbi:MAG TPA: hypothetical protein VN033_04350 [Vulgatibacter sp.]|nr:hypothetical protein [Vulgatibacter sp.]